LQKLKTFFPFCGEDVSESDNATLFHLLTNGKVGIVNHWSGQLSPIMDTMINPFINNYGFATLENPWGTVWAFGITSASDNKNEAFSFLLHITGANADLLQGNYSGSPVRRSTFNNQQAVNEFPWFPALLESIERKHTFPSSESFSDKMGHLYNMVHQVFSGNLTPEEAVQDTNLKLELK
jgi:multiple sugar transport system substrate-binding protein